MDCKHWIRGAMASAAVVLAMGCTVNTTEPTGTTTTTTPPASYGAASIRWSVAGSFDPAACSAHNVTTFDFRALDQATGAMTEATAPCSNFALTINLPPGQYTGNATLLGPDGRAKSTTLNLAPFSVGTGQTTSMDSDFPASSFY